MLDVMCNFDPNTHEDCVAVLPYELFDSLYHPNVPHYVDYCNQFAAAMNQQPKVRTLGKRLITICRVIM